MSRRQTFMALCLKGKVELDTIDNYVDQWHETPSKLELHDYLGMTREEYSLWLRVPDALPYIIKARREKQPLSDMVLHGYHDLKLTGRPDDHYKISRLQEWLEKASS